MRNEMNGAVLTGDSFTLSFKKAVRTARKGPESPGLSGRAGAGGQRAPDDSGADRPGKL